MSDDNDTDQRESLTKLLNNDGKPQKRRTTLNNTEDHDGTSLLNSQIETKKRNDRLKYGLIGGAIFIVIILAIVLPIVLSGGGGHDEPHVDPVLSPVAPNSTNNYFQVEGSQKSMGYFMSGEILQRAPAQHTLLGAEQQNFTPKIGLDWSHNISFGANNKLVERIQYVVDMVDFKTARLALFDESKPNGFTIPKDQVSAPLENRNMRLDMVGFKLEQDAKKPFSFAFSDVSDPTNVFVDTRGQNLVMADKYVQMDFVLPSRRQYGLGERQHAFTLGEGAWGMWASGHNGLDALDEGRGRGGEYGVHPFLLVQTKKPQEYFGMYFRNSGPQVPIIRFSDDNKTDSTTLSYITTGGNLEIYFFIHGIAKQVIADYHKVIGKGRLPPFWALGWQDASNNGTTEGIAEQVRGYYFEGLPLETIYLDKSSYNKSLDFLLDKTRISDVFTIKEKLQEINVKLVGYLDSVINRPTVINDTDITQILYKTGDDNNMFIKSILYNVTKTLTGDNLVGMQDDRWVVFIDWFNRDQKTAMQFWEGILLAYLRFIPVDGFWTSENEPNSQQQGEIDPSQVVPKEIQEEIVQKMRRAFLQSEANDTYYDSNWYKSYNSDKESTYYLPFVPGFDSMGPYDKYSISLNATHSTTNYTELNLHSLYGHAMMRATSLGLFAIPELNDNRQFLLTRSTFAGTGHYASYAIRPKYRSWDALKYTIPHMMNMNMFGIPHVGVDACGFYEYDNSRDKLDEELCLRWIQLTTFAPLARHTQAFTEEQSFLTGPLGFTDKAMKDAVKETMYDRMQYLRLIYTCMFEMTENGGTCFDPLFFHYPLDVVHFERSGVNDTFIAANTIKVSPIVAPQGANTTFQSHFPAGRWVNLGDFSEIIDSKDEMKDLKYRNTVNAHLRPGAIIPLQNVTGNYTIPLTTVDLQNMPLTLVINRDSNKAAKGTVFIDSGFSKLEMQEKTYEHYTVLHKSSKTVHLQLTTGLRGAQKANPNNVIDEILIADAEDVVSADFACAVNIDGSMRELSIKYDTANKALRISKMNRFQESLEFHTLQSVYYGASADDLNLCRESAYQYDIPEDFDISPVLASNNGTIPLVHRQGILPNLTLSLRMYAEGIVNVKWTWAEQPAPKGYRQHYEVPHDIVDTSRPPRRGDALGRHVTIQRSPFQLNFTQMAVQKTQPFLLLKNMIYDSYLNWVGLQAVTLKNDRFRGIMGLGERSSQDLFYKDGLYSMWATDEPTKQDKGVPPGQQGYGVHPFFMYQHTEEHWVGVFFKQAQAQDWSIRNSPWEGLVNINQIATGGLTDIYVMFNAQRPDTIVSMYQRHIVGKPVLPPQWALGWHQSKYCLRTQEDYRDVVDNYRAHGIPLDAQWADIDYMDRYRDFTVDPIYFGNLTQYISDLFHNMDIKFVPILDAGIAQRPGDNYPAYDEGIKQDVFLKMLNSNEPFKGMVWPNEAVFPDFFHKSTASWWESQLTSFHDNLLGFNGLWLDMNEAANFCNGACHDRQRALQSQLDNLYYLPTGRSLEYKSLPVDIVHANGYTQMDAHSYYGTQQAKATHDWFIKDNRTRPFIIERSSFAGLGKYAGKWLGDSSSTWSDLQRSVTGSMMMGIFGIPLVGGDICGFSGPNTTPDLCARWHQVGAFQLFSRNHRDCEGAPQEPYRFENDTVKNTTIMKIMKDAILMKYSLQKYMYTHLYLLSQEEQSEGTFYKPLFFEYPNDPQAYSANVSENVMIGPSLKLSIRTSPLNKMGDNETNEYYFPQGNWCDLVRPETSCIYAGADGTKQILPADIDEYQLSLREGHIIPMHNMTKIAPNTTDDLRKHPIDLVIHPKNVSTAPKTKLYTASGVYVNDDGMSVVSNLTGAVNQYSITFQYRDQVNEHTDDEVIRIYVGTKVIADRYYSNETQCAMINQNDFLGNIIIEDEVGLFARDTYTVEVLYQDYTFFELGLMKFDPITNRMRIIKRQFGTSDVCLNFIQEIRITAAITSQPKYHQ